MDFKRIFTGYWVVPFSWLFLIFFLYSWFGKNYSEDSFTYYLLGKNLTSGMGYYTSFVRDLHIQVTQPWFSRDFPPLFPLFVGLTDKITGAQIASGLVLNLVILFFILHVTYSMSTKVPGARGHFLFLGVLLFICWNKPFLKEIVQAGSLPLSLLILLCIVHFLTWKRYYKGLSSSICIGALLGLLALTRFDAILFCFLFPMIYIFESKDRFKKTLHAYIGLLLVLSPWLIRNWLVFNQLFASSDLANITSILKDPLQTGYYKYGFQTFSASPTLWIYQRTSNLLVNLNIFFNQIGIPGLILFLILIGTSIKKIRERQPWGSIHLLAVVWVFCNFITVSLTPHHGPKLFSISILLLLFSLIYDLIRFGNKSMILKPSMPRRVRILWAISVSILIVGTILALQKPIFSVTPKLQAAYDTLVEDFGKSLTAESFIATDNPATLHYFSGWKTIHIPHNARGFDENFMEWMTRWNVSHMIVIQEENSKSQNPFLDSKKLKPAAKFGSFHLLDLKPLLAPTKTETPSKPKQKASSKKT
jgi:4-amino-4-deoxy-L-arabinose transferase-like glycosyltransferase